MKKRIIAFILAFVISSTAIAETYRPARAELTAAAVITIGVAAWKIIGAMTGDNPQAMDAVNWCIQTNIDSAENFFDACVNPDSEFQTKWKSGFTQMCNTISNWFESGDITIDSDGNLHMNYEQYLQLYRQTIELTSVHSVDFYADYDAFFLKADLSIPIFVENLTRLEQFYSTNVGQSYCPVYYDDNQIIFADYFTLTNSFLANNTRFSFLRNGVVNSSFQSYFIGDTLGGGCDFSFILSYSPVLFIPSLDSFTFTYQYYGEHTTTRAPTHCFVFDGNNLSYKPISDVDVSGMSSGLITTTGDFHYFLKSLTGFNVVNEQPDLDDLSNVIPDGKNPDIVVDTDPDVPVPDAVIIDDVPLSDYKTNLDIDIPSIIIDKFPFCVPFDFVRILSVLAAEPKAPVFRIPISTNLDNLAPFEGNQTIGNSPEDFEPMFEIDEEIVLDLSTIPLIQPISYTIFIIGFVIMLIILTPKMINH